MDIVAVVNLLSDKHAIMTDVPAMSLPIRSFDFREENIVPA